VGGWAGRFHKRSQMCCWRSWGLILIRTIVSQLNNRTGSSILGRRH